MAKNTENCPSLHRRREGQFSFALLSVALALSLVACGSPASEQSPSIDYSPSAIPVSAERTVDDMIAFAGARTLSPGLEDVYFSHKLLLGA